MPDVIKISWTIERCWLSEESFDLKPDWLGLSKMFSSRKSIKELKKSLSKIFPKIGKKETGLICLSPFLWSGNVPVLIQFLKMIDKGLTTDLLHNLIILIDISSCPCALLILRALIIFNMTSSLKENEESVVAETYCSELDNTLLLIRGVHFEAKKLLK